MASLRLLTFPSTSFPSTEQKFHQALRLSSSPERPPIHSCSISRKNLSISWRLSSSSPLPLRSKRISRFVVNFSSTTQDQVVESPETAEKKEEYSTTRLVAQNVPWTCTAEDIRALFGKHGTVVDVELSMHSKTLNRGLAFVTMGSPEEALAALNNLESSEFEGRILRLNYARQREKKSYPPPKPKPVPAFNLFVANLSYEARSKDLKEFFGSESDAVVSAEVIFHENPRKSSGYGFVSFKTKKAAEAALSNFQGKMFMGRPIRVARGKQFVKVQTKESVKSEDTTTKLNSSEEQAEAEVA